MSQSEQHTLTLSQRQILTNLKAILEEAGSSIDNVVKMNVFIAKMDDFDAMNVAYDEFFNKEPKPVSPLPHVPL